jgi:sulfatase maturation enzyme AslB (radical SAM superfamily)
MKQKMNTPKEKMATQNLSQKICPYPFSRMELGNEKAFVPCCINWLKNDFLKIDRGVDAWNGAAAQELRSRILQGDYRYCHRDLCKIPLEDPSDLAADKNWEAPLTEVNRMALLAGETVMPEGPSSFSIINDRRCNLACPSCRQEHILTVDDEAQLKMNEIDLFIEQQSQTLQVLKLAGDGELFFSPWLKSIVKRIDAKKFPRFRLIHVLSNGLLFNEEMYQSLLPGAEFIRQVCISVDAGNAETYLRVRGGSWEKLLKNLFWLGVQKKLKTIPYFQMNFTVRLENFESMLEFIQLAKNVGASHVKFTAFFQFPDMAVSNYAEQAIHLSSHPRHQELRKIWLQIKEDPFVRWSLPVPALISI